MIHPTVMPGVLELPDATRVMTNHACNLLMWKDDFFSGCHYGYVRTPEGIKVIFWKEHNGSYVKGYPVFFTPDELIMAVGGAVAINEIFDPKAVRNKHVKG